MSLRHRLRTPMRKCRDYVCVGVGAFWWYNLPRWWRSIEQRRKFVALTRLGNYAWKSRPLCIECICMYVCFTRACIRVFGASCIWIAWRQRQGIYGTSHTLCLALYPLALSMVRWTWRYFCPCVALLIYRPPRSAWSYFSVAAGRSRTTSRSSSLSLSFCPFNAMQQHVIVIWAKALSYLLLCDLLL